MRPPQNALLLSPVSQAEISCRFVNSCSAVLLSEGGGTRTHDLGIKSPLLYQLSYAPERRKH